MRYLKLTWLTIKKDFKSAASYKTSFILNMFSQLLEYVARFAIIFIVVSKFGNINGWNQYEVMLLYGISLAAYSLSGFLFYDLAVPLPRTILSGAFDEYLVKPVRIFPYLISTKFNKGYLSHLTLSLILISICFAKLSININLNILGIIFIIIFSGALVYASFFMISTIPAFFIGKTDGIFKSIFFFRSMINYPISIYPNFLKFILIYILPYGMINFFPVQILLEKNDLIYFSKSVMYVSPVIGVSFFSLSILLFNIGIKYYKGSGS